MRGWVEVQRLPFTKINRNKRCEDLKLKSDMAVVAQSVSISVRVCKSSLDKAAQVGAFGNGRF
ncbi:hypothetical protein DEA98_00190 [Brucella pseudogrignonensis]|nr:hypothetical protein [Brucella pseudogrignonensis]